MEKVIAVGYHFFPIRKNSWQLKTYYEPLLTAWAGYGPELVLLNTYLVFEDIATNRMYRLIYIFDEKIILVHLFLCSKILNMYQ